MGRPEVFVPDEVAVVTSQIAWIIAPIHYRLNGIGQLGGTQLGWDALFGNPILRGGRLGNCTTGRPDAACRRRKSSPIRSTLLSNCDARRCRISRISSVIKSRSIVGPHQQPVGD
jgi:hypothetical protein